MIFSSISGFRKDVQTLRKRSKDGYESCKQDIINTLQELTFKQLSDLPSLIFMIDKYKLIKVRIPNSAQKLSRSDGFRLYIFINQETEEVSLLTIYPKRGPQSILSITKEQEKRLIQTYKVEKENLTIVNSNILEEVI